MASQEEICWTWKKKSSKKTCTCPTFRSELSYKARKQLQYLRVVHVKSGEEEVSEDLQLFNPEIETCAP